MTMIEGINRLLEVLSGLGFSWTNKDAKSANAQRKLSKQVGQWFTIIIWTTVTENGPLPKGQRAVKSILVGAKERLVWKLKKTLRYKDRETFAKRLRRRANLLTELAKSRQSCVRHPQSFMSLAVTAEDALCWVCGEPGCNTVRFVPALLARRVQADTSERYWQAQRLAP